MTSACLMARFFPFIVVIGLSTLFSYGRSGNDPRILWQDNKFGYLSGLQEKLDASTDFYSYARIRDEEFSEYLKEPWHDFSIVPGITDESRSLLKRQPVFNYAELDNSSPANLPYAGVMEFDEKGSGQVKGIPRIRKPESDVYTSMTGTFLFYGQQISIRYDKLLTLAATSTVSEDSISGFWKSFSRANSNHLVDQLMDYRDLLGLGDWGYFQLVKAVSCYIFPDQRWRTDQLTWALMIRSGFDVRLAFNQASTTLLFSSENTIYSRQYVVIGQRRFYLDREMKSQLLVTCPNPFPNTNRMIDLRFYKSLNFSGKLAAKKYLVQWEKDKYQFTFHYNPESIRFYSDYPKTEPAIYFGAPVSSVLKEDIIRQFYPLVSKINKAGAVALMQQFVQRAFEYNNSPSKKDVSISNGFAEELIASKMGDDRGKSVLFSYLIRTLLHLPVVGVQFPGYFSTAICFDEPLDGDSYSWKRRKYLFTDPTFLNAPIGVVPPEFKQLTPQLIELPNANMQLTNASEIWKQAFRMGARLGGSAQDIIFDHQGRALITGYFTGPKSINPFIACFSEVNSLQWIRKFEGEGIAEASAITKVNDDEIYIVGSFSGKIMMDGISLQSQSKRSDLFIAQFNQNGELIWMKSVVADMWKHNESIACLVKIDRTGDNISLELMNEDFRNINTGFGGVSEIGLYFTTTLTSSFQSRSKVDIPGELFREYTSLREKYCHQKVAGLMAVMKWLQMPGNEVTGNQIQTLMTRITPAFAADHPVWFSNLGRIALFKNENGHVILKTVDRKPLLFSNMRLENGAEFKITVFGNRDISLGIISGFEYVISPFKFSLNSLLINSSSGNFLFDYDLDHTITTMSFDF